MIQLPLVVFLAIASLMITYDARAEGVPGEKIRFRKVVLDTKFRSEGVAVADFNRDGKADVAAGRVIYEAPDWRMRAIDGAGKAFDPNGYSGSFCTFADDLNGDGWADVLVVDFPGTPTYWYENPHETDRVWKRHTIAAVSNNESPTYLDIDGDGQRELIMTVAPADSVDGPERRMAILTRDADPIKPWTEKTISAKAAPGTQRYSHGLGVGDVNRDGRNDVLVPEGWWESPAEKSAAPWTFRPAPLGQQCAQMYVYDYDGDGDSDVISSSAHAVGIWLHEQSKNDGGEPAWKTHVIDRSFSQTHGMCSADLNGDGLPDFVTGKRWWAHGPKGDVDPDKPAVLYWFELKRQNGKATWTPYKIDDDSGVGTQFEIADINGDGLLDIATANKKGARIFLQER